MVHSELWDTSTDRVRPPDSEYTHGRSTNIERAGIPEKRQKVTACKIRHGWRDKTPNYETSRYTRGFGLVYRGLVMAIQSESPFEKAKGPGERPPAPIVGKNDVFASCDAGGFGIGSAFHSRDVESIESLAKAIAEAAPVLSSERKRSLAVLLGR